MAIAAGAAEEQSQDPQLPAPSPEPAVPLGTPFWLSCGPGISGVHGRFLSRSAVRPFGHRGCA